MATQTNEETELASILMLEKVAHALDFLADCDNTLDPFLLDELENELDDRRDLFLYRYYEGEYTAWRDIEGEDDLFIIWNKFKNWKGIENA
jgi:hypothetical protein